jgi:IMP dehydrogenase
MFRETLTYDDVLLVPQYSDIESRKEISIGNWLDEERGLWFDLPIISSPMDTITEDKMAILLGKMGGLGIVHRYNTIERQCEIANTICQEIDSNKFGCAIGVTGDYLERATALVESNVKILCLDVAHGDHILMKNALITLREKLGNGTHLMAGNVATLSGFDNLASWGANSIRIGIGGGSICSTRIQTGHGVPSLDSVIDCVRTDKNVAIIADGGIRNSGDIVKALGVGADFAMLGSVLAGSDKTPGELYVSARTGEASKTYRGMASKDAQMDWRGKTSSLEGVSASIPFKGETRTIIEQLDNGIRSGFSYSGARTINEFWYKARFIKQSSAAARESDTHILHRKS